MTKKIIILSSLILVAISAIAVCAYFIFFKRLTPTESPITKNLHSIKNSAPWQKYNLTYYPEVLKIDPSLFLPTDNWEIYRDSNIGFEFKYPKDWPIDNGPGSPKNYNGIVFSSPGLANRTIYDRSPSSQIALIVTDSPKNISLREYALIDLLEHKYAERGTTPGLSEGALQNVQIGDNKFMGTYKFTEDDYINAYFDLGNNKVLTCTISGTGSMVFSETFYTILSTIKIDKVK